VPWVLELPSDAEAFIVIDRKIGGKIIEEPYCGLI